LKVILTQDIKKLGKKGDMVNASDGYARNYLFPNGMAAPADAQNITEAKNAKASQQHRIDLEVAAAEEIKKNIDGKTVEIKAKAGKEGRLFGSVTAKDIAGALKNIYDADIEKRKITVSEIKAFGTYNAQIKLYNGITADIKVMVTEE
jgi:large subunit ribosomal protein L9